MRSNPKTWFIDDRSRRILTALRRQWLFSLLPWVLLACATPAWALQTQPAEPARTLAEIDAELERRFEEFRDLLKQTSQARANYFQQDRGQSVKNRQDYENHYRQARDHKDLLEKLLIEKFEATPQPDDTLYRMVKSIAEDYFRAERMYACFALTEKLLRVRPDDDQVRILHGGSAIVSNQIEVAKDFRQSWGFLIKELPKEIRYLYDDLDLIIGPYEREMQIRAAEAKADDLPRVLISTSRGDITVELFENEAPHTVGNFVKLVETGYYNRGLDFHRVIPGFVAQGAQDPTGLPNYTIYDEFGSDNDRPHLAYVLAMANADRPNSAAAEFYFTLRPVMDLNRRYAVFGRVIEGFDVVERITKTYDREDKPKPGVVPDKILAAKVLRKRDHEYLPKIFQYFKLTPQTQSGSNSDQ